MSDHVFRQSSSVDPFRAWVRKILPSGKDGFVITDLDIAVRRFGKNYGLDGEGDLLLIEKKEFNGRLENGQKRVYDWLSKIVSKSDKKEEWRGWRELRIIYADKPEICKSCGQPVQNDDDVEYRRFLRARIYLEKSEWVNNFLQVVESKEITHDELKKFLEGK